MQFRGFLLQDRPILFSALKPLPSVPPKKQSEADNKCVDGCNLSSSVFQVEVRSSIQKHLSIKVRGEADIGSLTASVHRSSEHKSLCSLLMFQYSRILTDVAARQP